MDAFDKYIGRVFDKRYRIEKVIGVGGMAIVFKAEDILMNRTVAIKMLKNDMSEDSEALRRFINESKAVAMLSHENIVNIYDVSVKGNTKYIVMEYIEGITLKSFLKRKGGTLSWRETLNITEQILRALEHAHSKGVIHRDIKPQNIMLLKNGLIKVADFGIAKLPDNDTFTLTDKAIGTVNYISPEQATNEGPADERSDLYSVGVLMYELSCGQLPFSGDTPVAVAYKHVNDIPKHPREIRPDMPEGLDQIIMRAMEKSPERRFRSAKQMLSHINALKENPAIKFRNPADEVDVKAEKRAKKAKQKKEKKKKKKEVRERGGLVMPILMGVLFALMIVVIVIGVLTVRNIFDKTDNVRNRSITVKSYVGSVYSDELKAELEQIGYTVIEKQSTRGNILNEIVEQDPPAGTTKLKNSDLTITLFVFKGTEKMVLPDFTYKYFNTVKSEFAAQFEFKAVRQEDQHVPADYVIRTDPAAGSEVEPNQVITVYVSKGYTPAKTTVPYICEISAQAARQLLLENGLVLGNIEYEDSDTPAGTVLRQSVDANSEVAVNTEISIVISIGPPETEPPETETEGPETGEPETDEENTEPAEITPEP